VVTEIKRIHKEGRPVLVGTTSVEKSELLSEMLAQEGIKHQVRAALEFVKWFTYNYI
jgi:preprotein translocase subunit SecA